MNILVCITHVPDTTTRIQFKDGHLDKQGVQFIIGPYDDYALARAVELKASNQATVTVLNVGEAETEPTLRKALAIGADKAIRVNAFPIDAHFVAAQIAEVCKQESYDLILMGRESIDYNGAQVHGLVGEMIGVPSVSPVMVLNLDGSTAKMMREIEGGKEELEAPLPLVLGCQEPIAEWKIPNMRGIMTARSKPLNVVEPVGTAATVTVEDYEMPEARGNCKMIDADNAADLVRLLREEAKVI
ncbi:MAG: electron transfer flavoprotein subunit beta/FixA family protein [Catalinimonas sp.]